MFPVQVHLVLTHVPLTGAGVRLVFYTLGIRKSYKGELLKGERFFAARGAISIPIVASGLRAAAYFVGGTVARYIGYALAPARWHPDSHSVIIVWAS